MDDQKQNPPSKPKKYAAGCLLLYTILLCLFCPTSWSLTRSFNNGLQQAAKSFESWLLEDFTTPQCPLDSGLEWIYSTASEKEQPILHIRNTASLDGDNQFTKFVGWASSPQWSPDGRQIAFMGIRTVNRLHILHADGTNGRIVFESRLSIAAVLPQDLSWSPDSRYVAFLYKIEDIHLFVADTVTNTTQELFRIPTSANVPPFWSETDRDITLDGKPEGQIDFAWSPDSQRLLINQWLNDKQTALYVLDREGKNQLTISDEGILNPQYGQWLADSKSIVFLGEENGVQNVYRYDLTGDKGGLLARNAFVLWNGLASNGDMLVYETHDNDLFLLDLKLMKHTNLTGSFSKGTYKEMQGWSADSGKFIYQVNDNNHHTIYLYDVTSGKQKEILSVDYLSHVYLSPDGNFVYYALGVPAKNADGSIWVKPTQHYLLDLSKNSTIEVGGDEVLLSFQNNMWTPNGEYFTYFTAVGDTIKRRMYLVNLKNGVRCQIGSTNHDYQWRPE